MASKKRLSLPFETHHIVSRCIDGKTLFTQISDCKKFQSILIDQLKKTGFFCILWGISHTHFHLLVRITDRPLWTLMQVLNSTYAKYLNKKNGTQDTIFVKFDSTAVQDTYLERFSTIIKNDSIWVGTGEDLHKINDYDWNKPCVTKTDIVELSKLTRKGSEKIATSESISRNSSSQFENHIIEKIINCVLKREDHHDQYCYIFGDESFIGKAMEHLKKMQVLANYTISGWTLEKLADFVMNNFDVSINELTKRGRLDKRSNARKLFAYLATWVQGYSLAQTARFLHISGCAVSRLAKKGMSVFTDHKIIFPENPTKPATDFVLV